MFIDLPVELLNTRALTNIRNKDEQCFLWAVLPAIHTQQNNKNRLTLYKQFENTINMDGIDYPVPLTSVPKFEKLLLISIMSFDMKTSKSSHYTYQLDQLNQALVLDLKFQQVYEPL